MTTETTTQTIETAPAGAPTEQDRLTAVIDAYIASWNEADDAKRAALVEQAWVPEGRMVDPLLDLSGHEQLAGLAPLLAEHYPGHRIQRTSEIDAHHQLCRFSWELTGPDGNAAIAGIDVCIVADDGRLKGVAGFFDA